MRNWQNFFLMMWNWQWWLCLYYYIFWKWKREVWLDVTVLVLFLQYQDGRGEDLFLSHTSYIISRYCSPPVLVLVTLPSHIALNVILTFAKKKKNVKSCRLLILLTLFHIFVCICISKIFSLLKPPKTLHLKKISNMVQSCLTQLQIKLTLFSSMVLTP